MPQRVPQGSQTSRISIKRLLFLVKCLDVPRASSRGPKGRPQGPQNLGLQKPRFLVWHHQLIHRTR